VIKRFVRLAGRQMDVQLRMRTFNLYSLLLFFLQPAVFSAVGMVLSRAAGNQAPDLVYTVIGGGILGMWSGLVFTSTFDIRSDRRDGTLELIVGSPTSLGTVEGIRTFTNVLAGLASMAAAFLAATLIFKYPLSRANLPAALFSLLLAIFGLWCLGMFLANFMVWSRLTTSLVDFFETPVAVLCGFMYPIRVLPGWMQAISAIFPIRWSLEALQDALRGSHDAAQLWRLWGLAFAISLAFLAVARLLEGKVHELIRVTGELNSI
jgi:ABC-2 type transport system permease protein